MHCKHYVVRSWGLGLGYDKQTKEKGVGSAALRTLGQGTKATCYLTSSSVRGAHSPHKELRTFG